MDSFPKYPEIVLLSKRPEIFAVKQVIATEKLHGSCFRLHLPCGMASIEDILYGSREMESTGHKFPLGNMVRWFKARPDLLTTIWEVIKSYGFSDATLFGEAYGPGIKTKGVKYSTGQEVLFRVFDIMVGTNFVTYDLFCEIADKMGLPRVHEIWRGEPTLEAFDALLEKPSVEGLLNGITDEGNLAEGVVIRSNPLFRDVFGQWLIIKHKSKRFSEVAHAPAPPKERGISQADIFASTYVTEGRVLNAVGRLQDRGVVLKNDMTDMPTLIAEILVDLHKECSEDWPYNPNEPDSVQSSPMTDKQVMGFVSRVLGPIYRKTL